MNNEADIIVIGAGIAGASVAAELAATHRVLILEMESQPGYHTTGRSAAMFVPSYGPSVIRALSRASFEFLNKPPPTFQKESLLSPRQALVIAREDQLDSLESLKQEVASRTRIENVTPDQMADLNPLLKKDYATAGFLDVDAKDIDVSALHQGYLRLFRERSGHVLTNARIDSISRQGEDWSVESGGQKFTAPIIINAAGAWVDEVNALADIPQIGLVPKRRTMIAVAAAPSLQLSNLSMTIDVDEKFFIKPETSQLLISPADETPSPPCDAQPEELDIAICIDRIQKAFDIPVTKIENKWAGLRSFVKDKTPVAGFTSDRNTFFILAGQGGYGIQTAPALSQFAAALVLGNPPPPHISDEGVTATSLSPQRLNTHHTLR